LEKEDKHADLLAKINEIIKEDEFNDKYGRQRVYEALVHKGVKTSQSTVYRVMKKHGLLQKVNKPKGLTKQDKDAYKSDDLLQGDFTADAPNEKYVTDITQLPTADGTLYISALFDCFDDACSGLSMSDNMKTPLVTYSLEATFLDGIDRDNPPLIHSDRGSQYTSALFQKTLTKLGLKQSMSFAGSSCFGNAKCESMWGRFKQEAIYGRYDTKKMSMEAVKSLVFRYFMGYWNHRRICSAIGGVPPMFKRNQFYEKQKSAVLKAA